MYTLLQSLLNRGKNPSPYHHSLHACEIRSTKHACACTHLPTMLQCQETWQRLGAAALQHRLPQIQ